jgi:hypothetical protein
MSLGYAHTLFCDRRGCRATVTVADTRNAAHARRLAHTRYHWRCDTTGDYCPRDTTARDASHARPTPRETPSHTGAETSHLVCDSKGER